MWCGCVLADYNHCHQFWQNHADCDACTIMKKIVSSVCDVTIFSVLRWWYIGGLFICSSSIQLVQGYWILFWPIQRPSSSTCHHFKGRQARHSWWEASYLPYRRRVSWKQVVRNGSQRTSRFIENRDQQKHQQEEEGLEVWRWPHPRDSNGIAGNTEKVNSLPNESVRPIGPPSPNVGQG